VAPVQPLDLDALERIPPLPQILTQLLASVRRPEPDVAEIDDIVRQEPLLAARLLRVANSAAYATRVPARTTREALVRLGIDEVGRLAVLVTASQALPVPRRDYQRFWQHSLGVARTAEAVARRCGALSAAGDADALFLAGLFHDVGEVALAGYRPAAFEQVRQLTAAQGMRQFEAELTIFGLDHGEVGAHIAEGWRLPPFVAGALRGHHRVERAPEDAWWPSAVISLADWLFSQEAFGDLTERHRIRLEPGTWSLLGLSGLGLDYAECIELAADVAETARQTAALIATL